MSILLCRDFRHDVYLLATHRVHRLSRKRIYDHYEELKIVYEGTFRLLSTCMAVEMYDCLDATIFSNYSFTGTVRSTLLRRPSCGMLLPFQAQ